MEDLVKEVPEDVEVDEDPALETEMGVRVELVTRNLFHEVFPRKAFLPFQVLV